MYILDRSSFKPSMYFSDRISFKPIKHMYFSDSSFKSRLYIFFLDSSSFKPSMLFTDTVLSNQANL